LSQLLSKVTVSDGVKDTSLKAKAFTYKAMGNKIIIKQQSLHLQWLYFTHLLSNW